jgi:hypothetical protein
VLHGYHGSAAILRPQMAQLAAAIPAEVELLYLDAPALSAGDFGWWHEGFRGWERTRDWALELLCAGPRIDGIFGFGQGAALTGLLAALRESCPRRRRAPHHPAPASRRLPHASSRCVWMWHPAPSFVQGATSIRFSAPVAERGGRGATTRGRAWRGGNGDAVGKAGRVIPRIVPSHDSLLLAGRFTDPLVIEHPGGHVIPGDDAVTTP